jgi:aspartyl-tRNA(Asn)/glutamyl-tRNA(Gln) amidotransferase subunit B
MFEKVSEEIDPVLAAKWLRRELVRVLNYNKKTIQEIEMDEKHMIQLLKLVESKKITDNVASKILEKLIEKPFDVDDYIKKEGLEAVSDVGELEKYCKEAIDENPNAVEDYKKGNEKALNFIVGQVMGKTKGKASPKEVNEIIKKLIKK